MAHIIGEIVSVKHSGKWYDAEVLDVSANGIYVYIYDLRIKKNVSNTSVR